MRYRRLGSTELNVSEIGLGTWQIGGPYVLGGKENGWGAVDDDVSRQVLRTALECGITFYDTADLYGGGHSEELLGEVLSGVRDKVIISTKFGNRESSDGKWFKDFSPAWMTRACEESLQRLKTDYIDLYLLHTPPADFAYSEEIEGALDKLKRQGKIRYYGVSIVPEGRGIRPSDQAMSILDSGLRCDAIELVHNMIVREAEEYLLPVCDRRQIGVIARVPLESGFLTGKFDSDTEFAENDVRRYRYPPSKRKAILDAVAQLSSLADGKARSMSQAALQYCLAAPGVSTVIAGARTPGQVRENAEAIDVEQLSSEEIDAVRRVLPSSTDGTTS